MITKLINHLKRAKSSKHINSILSSKCTKIAIRAYVQETGTMLIKMLSCRGNIVKHFNYNTEALDEFNNYYIHIHIIPNVEAKFTNDMDIVFNQTGISSFTIIKDNYTKRKGTVINV